MSYRPRKAPKLRRYPEPYLGESFGNGWVFVMDLGLRPKPRGGRERTGRFQCSFCATVRDFLLYRMRTKPARCKCRPHPSLTHGGASRHADPLLRQAYSSYAAMCDRCTNPKNRSYPDYRKFPVEFPTFESFLKEIGLPPFHGSLSRSNRQLERVYRG